MNIEATGRATYSPEDNKLRLYVGRVPRPEYERLRAEGWTSTPKQECDFVTTWTPTRRDTALEYGDGVIEDEDQPMAERAADRAERFGDYRDKRTDEATGHADRYDSGPAAHGYQSQARAERSAARHDRIADRAGDAWSKAEYWQSRTAGVISHALYKSTPGVRMGRIKVLEAELRKHEAELAKRRAFFECWQDVRKQTDTERQTRMAYALASTDCWLKYPHPITGVERDLYDHLRSDSEHPITGAQAAELYFSDHGEPAADDDWSTHYRLRLAYENQMLEAQGGRAAHVEMIPGGWLGSRQIQKVNKSAVTGRVVSVAVKGTHTGFTRASGYTERATVPCLVTVETERLAADAYRAPTPEELAKFEAERKAAKAAAPKTATIPLINPTDADAERLQALWNERAKVEHDETDLRRYGKVYEEFKPAKVARIPQAVYSAVSRGGYYARAETRGLRRDAQLAPAESNMYNSEQAKRDKAQGPAVCNLRITSGNSHQWPYVKSVIVLTDKPQKPLPAAVWEALPELEVV